MKVGDLIKDTSWLPGADYDGARPAVSVLLPTFRRGADGTFMRAARSVLEQSERRLELIVVDDASTDGTADQIEALMRADGRVSCLRHRTNIGLPAVSEYEAFRRARAPYLAFAFDDFVFRADALARLLEAAERLGGAVVHGTAESFDEFGQDWLLGAERASCERLAFANFIGNSSVIVPRAVVDDVGFFDPHLAATRLCDWDLWRRIVREYPIFREDVLVGRELGQLRADSLGRTYPMYFEAVQEYCNRRRDEELRPANLERFDVWAMPPEPSACLAEHVLLMRRFFRTKAWAAGLGVEPEGDANPSLTPRGRCIAVVADMTPSTSLCFDGLPESERRRLLFVPLAAGDFHFELFLARSDAAILVRNLVDEPARQVARLCRWMDVPLYYLIDDNLIVLGADDPELAGYTREAVTEALADFAGILCTSASLAEYFESLHVRPPVHEIGPVFDAVKLVKIRRLRGEPGGSALRVGFIGGPFRRRNLEEQIVPALAAVARDAPVTFFSPSPPANAGGPPFPVTTVAFSPHFDDFLTTWGALGLGVVVHARGDTANIEYKTGSVLLSALYLGAVPIVAREPAFRDVGEAQGVLQVDGDTSSWERALRRVQAPDVRREMLSRLEAFCRTHFAAERTARTLDRILAASTPADLATWARRGRQARLNQVQDFTRAHIAARAKTEDLARRDGEVTEREARAAQLEHEASALVVRVAELEQEAGVRDARIAELKQEAAARDVRVVQLEQDGGAREARVTQLEQAVVARETRVTQLEQEVVARETRVTQLEQAAVTREARVAELEYEATARQAHLALLQAELGTRAYALSLKLRKIVHAMRRLAFGSHGS